MVHTVRIRLILLHWLVNQMVMEMIWDVSGIRVFMR